MIAIVVSKIRRCSRLGRFDSTLAFPRSESASASMSDVENVNGIWHDGKEDTIGSHAFAVNELTDLRIERTTLLGQRATLGKILQSLDGCLQAVEPFHCAAGSVFSNPLVCLVDVPCGGALDDDAIFHAPAGILCLRRRRWNTALAGWPSPRAKLSRPSLMPAMASACSTVSSRRR